TFGKRHSQIELEDKTTTTTNKMKIWKALLLVSFLVYAVHCEEEETKALDEVEQEDAPEASPQQQEDEPMTSDEETNDEETNDEETNDEETNDEEGEETHEEEEQDEPQEQEDEEEQDEENVEEQSDAYRPKVRITKVFKGKGLFKNKKVSCGSSLVNLGCKSSKKCIRRKRYYKKRVCVRSLITTVCRQRITTTCKVCSRFRLRKCYLFGKKYLRCRTSKKVYTRCRKTSSSKIQTKTTRKVVNHPYKKY
uniref:Cnidarian restricted protein n=1 Tax=Clytia hemisphaerica TaxID=252671 RepID=A0A7M5XLG9_9CNID